MLTFILKKEWYDKIKNGEKTVEYLEVKPYWTRRFKNAEFRGGGMHWDHDRKLYVFDNFSAPCFFRPCYTKDQILEAWITKLEIIDGQDTDLHINKPVYAIHFALTRQYGIQLVGNKGQITKICDDTTAIAETIDGG